MDFQRLREIVHPSVDMSNKEAWAYLTREMRKLCEEARIDPRQIGNLTKVAWFLRQHQVGVKSPLPLEEIEYRWQDVIIRGLNQYGKTNRGRRQAEKDHYKEAKGWKKYYG